MTHPESTNVGPNPSGLCMCGCGVATPIATRSDARRGSILGMPRRYIVGHNTRKSPVPYSEEDRGYNGGLCWVWQRSLTTPGYGQVRIDGKLHHAHRVYYESANGPIPDGLDLDHLCRVRACVNPTHLEPVSRAVNIQRGSKSALTRVQVAEIRSRGQGQNQTATAHEFGVDASTICRILAGKTWR